MIKEEKLRKLLIIGDRVLIKPQSPNDRTKAGLYLPPNVIEKEVVQTGYVIKTGPGYPIPAPTDDIDELWKKQEEKTKYLPLQVKEDDIAIFL